MKKIPFRAFRHALTVPAVKIVIFIACITPRPVSRLNAFVMGWILSVLPLPSNRLIRKHQHIVMTANNIYTSAHKIYSSVLIGFFDFFYLSYRSDETFRSIVKMSGLANMEKALSYGKGIIAVTAHYGPWELLPRAMKLHGYTIGVVGKSFSQKGASRILDELRQKPGIETIDRDSGAGPILRLLRRNGTLGILIDQNTNGVQSESVDFLGFPARTPVAPAVLATKIQAPVVTIHIKRGADSNYHLEIDEPVFFSEEQTTQEILTLLNQRISQWILAAPEQWVWFHNRWRL